MKTKAQKKEGMHEVMHEFKHGQLHSGSKTGPTVTNRKQAIAIALKQTGQSRYAGGGIVIPFIPSVNRGPFLGVPKLAFGGRPRPMNLRPPHIQFSLNRMPMREMFENRHGFIHMEKGGFIHSKVPGRTDKHYVKVKEGSYVLPADHVSALGQNNSIAGAEAVKKMFEHGQRFGPRLKIPKFAGGGAVEPVPIVVAGGEIIIPPEIVKRIGKDSLERGHQILDKWVLATREKHIKKLESLKPPKGAK